MEDSTSESGSTELVLKTGSDKGKWSRLPDLNRGPRDHCPPAGAGQTTVPRSTTELRRESISGMDYSV